MKEENDLLRNQLKQHEEISIQRFGSLEERLNALEVKMGIGKEVLKNSK